jgi:pimeloyl-ACP methyl ester carboxylesterase
VSEPVSSFVEANRLRHHVLRWEPEALTDPTPILLCHGYLDVAWSFRFLAEALVARGRRVIAFDWRGHGETEWVGRGGYYHFADYVLDLAELTRAIGLVEGGYDLVGHSMGGTACAMFAATRPPGLRALALLEGTGPPATAEETLPERIELWLSTVARLREKAPRPLRDLDDAIARLRVMHPDLEGELARFVASKHTVERDGALWFAFDPLHRTRAPVPFRVEAFLAQLARIEVPTLVVSGGRGWKPEDQAARVARLRDARELEIPDVGHMLHWHAPGALAAALGAFFADGRARRGAEDVRRPA